MFEILKKLGCTVKKNNKKIIINSSKVNKFEIPEDLMREMRSSVVLAGAIIGKYHKAEFSYPGGCDIGTRPIDLHLKSFEKLGINISENYGNIRCKCDTIENAKIDLDFPSVGATENIILASCLGNGTTIITNSAREPEIIDLQNFLNKMGANISGAGTNIIKIKGVKKLKDVSYNIMPDRIEAGTFLCAGAITGGKIKVVNVIPEQLTPIIAKLEETGCKIETGKNYIYLIAPKRTKAIDIKTMPYPGFPTDMQSVFGALLATSKGVSIIVENIFESRYKYVQELTRMGAKITIEGRTAVIKGTKRIHSATVKATDLRGGAAMVLEGLVAKGKTKIENIQYILRGYEDFDKKLQSLGAKISIKEGE
jgi:UDP-N-acetylglucosamine 1-carboxyvinyltransferase